MEKQKINSPVLKTRREAVSAIICTFPGGRRCAANLIGMPLKKFDNHAYENNSSRPLTDMQLYRLEKESGTQYLPQYLAALYGGLFVAVADPETLDNVELYSRSVHASAQRGLVDMIIAQALEDGRISGSEAGVILNAHNLHMAARHAEVLAAIELYRDQSGTGK
ncbi:hypothetical protein A584_16193 [Pseudomonas syringae pv. theae ICMP 3923]|uniref:Phage protein n=1 Tax=Pseudomonas syringae pv. theae TaxID=103985 RepID=A0A0Q0E1I2_PSESX|nr:YmfL family putative regulatory protein [Pseudomonas syringae]EPM68861.1 hypothetical protein A584_16193 [Pseudomonas syringae pv. theae ICMP 3923]KPZ31647.1 hypothetical protein AN901_205354 [Pseudomonas syringae pv. theae]MBL3873524.1 hypothetical protein [Pseudomonas syringae pv. theae]RMT64013.1 hypothetical protein ALP44_03325 [Pseudomonas syringae pv. theae]GKQ28315.1 PTS sugar transporter subunit IIA [Pseudomonas syringae pv. theae]